MRRSLEAVGACVLFLAGFTCPNDRDILGIEFLPQGRRYYAELDADRAREVVRRDVYLLGDTATQYLVAVRRNHRERSFPPGPVTFTSSDPGVATVSSTGFVRTQGLGETSLRATYQEFSDTLRIAVVPRVAELRLAIAPATLHLGQTGIATVTAYDSAGVRFPRTYAAVSSDNNGIAEALDGRFTVVGRTVGSTTILALFAGQDVRVRAPVSVIP